MNKDILINFLKKESVPTGSLKVLYNFNEVSGGIVFNDLHSKNSHIIDGCINSDAFPGFVSCTGSSFLSASGSGFFDSSSIVRVGYKVPYNSWTTFLNFTTNQNIQTRKLGQVILSSAGSGSSLSGFSVGLNGANKLYFEYRSSANHNKTITFPKEMGNSNVVSISRLKTSTSNSIEFIDHDITNNKNTAFSFLINDSVSSTDSIDSDIWFLGNYLNSSSGYTGYSGHIDDFVLFNKALSISEKNFVSPSVFLSGYSPETVGFEQVSFPLITGVTESSILSGIGITGFQNESLDSVALKCGGSYGVCFSSGVTGQIFQTGFTFATGAGSGTFSRLVTIPEQFLYSDSYLAKYAEDIFLFLESGSTGSIYEVYSYQRNSGNLNLVSVFSPQNNGFLLDKSYTGQNVHVYVNGLLQKTGTINGGNVISGDFVINNFRRVDSKGFYDPLDAAIYDKIDGSQLFSGFTGNGSEINISSSLFFNKDLYLNGQKLISGLEYEKQPSLVKIFASGLATGEFHFAPLRSLTFNRVTGSSVSGAKTIFPLIDEQIWLNGVRQINETNYIKVNEISINGSNLTLEKGAVKIYNNDNNFFNQ